jgi:hypothetical protein
VRDRGHHEVPGRPITDGAGGDVREKAGVTVRCSRPARHRARHSTRLRLPQVGIPSLKRRRIQQSRKPTWMSAMSAYPQNSRVY